MFTIIDDHLHHVTLLADPNCAQVLTWHGLTWHVLTWHGLGIPKLHCTLHIITGPNWSNMDFNPYPNKTDNIGMWSRWEKQIKNRKKYKNGHIVKNAMKGKCALSLMCISDYPKVLSCKHISYNLLLMWFWCQLNLLRLRGGSWMDSLNQRVLQALQDLAFVVFVTLP